MDLDFIQRFDVEDGLVELLVDHMAAAHAENRTVTPGGVAAEGAPRHAAHPGRARGLGRGSGPAVAGALLNPAFDEAVKRYPRLIPPGQSPTSVWGESLEAPKNKRRKRNGHLEYTCRVRMGDKQETGVPVLLKTLMNIDDAGNDSTGPKEEGESLPGPPREAEARRAHCAAGLSHARPPAAGGLPAAVLGAPEEPSAHRRAGVVEERIGGRCAARGASAGDPSEQHPRSLAA